jgi:hypothetical protein
MATMELAESASSSKCSSISNCAPSKGFPCSDSTSTELLLLRSEPHVRMYNDAERLKNVDEKEE